MAHVLNHPDLQQFALKNVRLTGRTIGRGAYGSVEEGTMPGAQCAVKKIHDIFQDRAKISQPELQKMAEKFVKECRLMSTLRHPHIVQFLGVCFLQGSQLPALVMERLMTNLHDLLETQPNIKLSIKRSVLYDVARGLCYLHDRLLIHRDLSARNVLLNSAMGAKIGDMGVARIVPSLKASYMTEAPGASTYMPPEAVGDRAKYSTSIDIFSFGVVAIFTFSQMYPKNVLPPFYRDEERREVIRNELERRNEYMKIIFEQFGREHPFIQMIKGCLERYPEDRLCIQGVIQLLEKAGANRDDVECHSERLALVHTITTRDPPTPTAQETRCLVSEVKQVISRGETNHISVYYTEGQQGEVEVEVGEICIDDSNMYRVFLQRTNILECLKTLHPIYQLGPSNLSVQRTQESIEGGEWIVKEIPGLAFTDIGIHGARALAGILKLTSGLQTLNLGGCSIEIDGVQAIAEFLRSCTSLKKLYLYKNGIDNEGITYLVDGLQECTTLLTLSLGANNIGDGGARPICDFAKSCDTLQGLHLDYNALTDECAELISDLIQEQPSLSNLWLFGNNFSENGKENMRQAVTMRRRGMNTLYVDIDENVMSHI